MSEVEYELDFGCSHNYWRPVITPEEALNLSYDYDQRRIARCEKKNFGKWTRGAMSFKGDEHVG